MVTASYIEALPTSFAPRKLQQTAPSVHTLVGLLIDPIRISKPALPETLKSGLSLQPRCLSTRRGRKPRLNWKGDSSMIGIRVLEG